MGIGPVISKSYFQRIAAAVPVAVAVIAGLAILFWILSPTERDLPPSDNAESTTPSAAKLPARAGDTLAGAAATRNIAFGTAVNSAALDDEQYRTVLREQFNIVTPETGLKWAAIEPSRGAFDFAEADAFMDVAAANGQLVRGHTLIWHRSIPSWVEEGSFTRDELLPIYENYIKTTVGRYKDRIQQWDVVNEPFDDDGNLRDSLWQRAIGDDYIELAFRYAHEADPSAQLYLNEVGAETSSRKSDAMVAFVSDLQSRDVPIQGIGYEAHQTDTFDSEDADKFRQSMADVAALGLDVAITELDVRVRVARDGSYDAERQDEVYRTIAALCLEQDACKTMVVWGFTDGVSWVPGRYPGWGGATLFTESYEPKSAFTVIRDELYDR